jgi:hypothetical protein
MSGVWGPPPPAPEDHRIKTPFCGARNEDGTSRCDLYRGHISDLHVDSHTHETWSVG